MFDWNRPRRVRNMRRVLRQHGSRPPKGCEFWVLTALVIITAVLAVVGSWGIRH